MLGVTRQGEDALAWAFDTPIVSVTSVAGLLADASQEGRSYELLGEATLLVVYRDPIGTAWSVDVAGVAITFANGGTLTPQSGLIA